MEESSTDENSLYAWGGCAGLLTIEGSPDQRATANVASRLADGAQVSDAPRPREPGHPIK
jgi:hypothetical protein